MADILLSGLQPAAPISGSDLTLARQGSEDKKASYSQIKDYIAAQSEFNAMALLTKLLTVDGAGSGVDADLLDGQHGSYYQNATNLSSGTLPIARLPMNYFLMATNGGIDLNASFGDLKIRWGQGSPMSDNTSQTISFSTPFPTACYHVFVTGEGRRDGWDGVTSAPQGPFGDVELYVGVWKYNAANFTVSCGRMFGTNADQVIPHYFAIGK